MVKVDFLPRQYQIIVSPEDMLELILGLRQYVREFGDEGTFRIEEMLEIFESKFVGDLPQTGEEEPPSKEVQDEQPDTNNGEGDLGGAAHTK